jgi:hypothetical protein
MNDAEVIQDFRRRWEGTYIWLSIEGRGDELVHLDAVDTSSGTKVATLNLSSDKIGKLSINLGSAGHTLQFRYPPVGVFQFKENAYVFYRRPMRQYRRGICGDNSLMWNVSRNLTGNVCRWTPQEVRAAFEHETYDITTALTLLEKGYKGVALDSNFSLTQSMFENPDYVLWHWTHPIGRVNSKGKVTQLYENGYKTLVNQMGFANNG